MTKEIIKLEQITVDFGAGNVAVKNVDLTVNQGEIYGIIGYSGAGKSTLVRVINLLQQPTAGRVLVNGQDLRKLDATGLRQARKKIGMIFQHFNLLHSQTVLQNVLFALRTSNLTASQKKAKAENLLELVDLADKKDSYPNDLSGGQKQRVAIARALANDPDILISDEGTSALDPKNTEAILNLLKEINQKTGLTIVLITHQMEAVKQICQKVAVMEQGEIIERGTLLEIFAHPKEPLTKDFVNTTTRLDAALEAIAAQTAEHDLKLAGRLVQLSYVGNATDEPLISMLFKMFHVVANILYGNIEILQGEPLGKLIVSLSGSDAEIKQAIAWLISEQVQVKDVELKEALS